MSVCTENMTLDALHNDHSLLLVGTKKWHLLSLWFFIDFHFLSWTRGECVGESIHVHNMDIMRCESKPNTDWQSWFVAEFWYQWHPGACDSDLPWIRSARMLCREPLLLVLHPLLLPSVNLPLPLLVSTIYHQKEVLLCETDWRLMIQV